MNGDQGRQERQSAAPPQEACRRHRWLVVVSVLLALAAGGLWMRPASMTGSAAAGAVRTRKAMPRVFMDSGQQRKAIIDELAKVNAKLDKLVAIMSSGKMKVVVVSTDTGGADARDDKRKDQ